MGMAEETSFENVCRSGTVRSSLAYVTGIKVKVSGSVPAK